MKYHFIHEGHIHWQHKNHSNGNYCGLPCHHKMRKSSQFTSPKIPSQTPIHHNLKCHHTKKPGIEPPNQTPSPFPISPLRPPTDPCPSYSSPPSPSSPSSHPAAPPSPNPHSKDIQSSTAGALHPRRLPSTQASCSCSRSRSWWGRATTAGRKRKGWRGGCAMGRGSERVGGNEMRPLCCSMVLYKAAGWFV